MIVILASPFHIFYLITLYGMAVPYWDEWEFAPLLVKARAGTLTFSDLWIQHNEHRPFFPRVIILSLIYLTNWNIQYHLYANFILAALTFLVLYLLLRSSFDNRVPKWLPVALSLLIFSPIQWENWSGGLSIPFFLNVSCAAAAIYALSKWCGRIWGLVIAIAFAAAASYSSNNGLLLWIAAAPLLIRRVWQRWAIVAWFAAFILTVVFYYLGYKPPVNHPSLLSFIYNPYDFTKFVLAYIGMPIGRGCGTRCSVLVGASLLAVFGGGAAYLLLRFRERFDKLLPWFAIGLYVFLTDLATAVGRIGFGLRESLSDRYSTFSTPFTISALVVAASLISLRAQKSQRPSSKVNAAIICVLLPMLVFYSLSFFHGVSSFKSSKALTDAARSCLMNTELGYEECLDVLYPDADALRLRIGFLKEAGLLDRMWWHKPDDSK